MRVSRVFCVIIVCVILACAVDTSHAEGRRRIAILELGALNVPKNYAKIVGDLLEVELHKSGAFDILERKQMEIILNEQGLALSGCTDESCAIRIGRLLSADMVVTGSLNKLGDYLLTIKVVDARSGAIVLADYERSIPEDQLPDRAGRIAKRLSSAIGSVAPGRENQAIESAEKEDNFHARRTGNRVFVVECGVRGYYVTPAGRFSEIAKPGYGSSLYCGVRDVLISGLFAGVDLGYWRFEGNRENVEWCSMVPVMVEAGYAFHVFRGLYISPVMGGGYSYNTMNFKRTVWTSTYEAEHEFEPVARGGLCTGYNHGSISAKIGVFYTGIFEKTERLDSYMLSAGLGVFL